MAALPYVGECFVWALQYKNALMYNELESRFEQPQIHNIVQFKHSNAFLRRRLPNMNVAAHRTQYSALSYICKRMIEHNDCDSVHNGRLYTDDLLQWTDGRILHILFEVLITF